MTLESLSAATALAPSARQAAYKALAARRHNGNVSALLKEFASREAKFVAGEEFIASCGFPPLSDAAVARIEGEWRGEKPAKTAKKARGRAA